MLQTHLFIYFICLHFFKERSHKCEFYFVFIWLGVNLARKRAVVSCVLTHGNGAELTWWPAACSSACAARWGPRAAGSGTRSRLWWETPSRRCSRSPGPGGPPHLDAEKKQAYAFLRVCHEEARAPTRGSPSTREVRSVTLAALRLPAGKFRPIFSSFSRKHFPPFFDLALRGGREGG